MYFINCYHSQKLRKNNNGDKIYENNKIDSLVVDGVHQTVAEGNSVIPLETKADIKRLEVKNIFGGECLIEGNIEKLITD